MVNEWLTTGRLCAKKLHPVKDLGNFRQLQKLVSVKQQKINLLLLQVVDVRLYHCIGAAENNHVARCKSVPRRIGRGVC
jgi:hypothetical protein